MALEAGHFYWTNYDTDTIGRANVDGSGVEQSFIAGARYPYGIIVPEPAPAAVRRPASPHRL